MEISLQKVTDAALHLPEADRESLAFDLIRSLNVAKEIEAEIQMLPDDERQQVEEVLESRIDGPFERVDDLDAWKANIKQRGRERLVD